jgi:uncharacterized protein YyaL (SSP411 family)
MGFEILERALSIVIIGDGKELVRAAIEVAPPWRVILRIPTGATLAGNHPAYGKKTVNKPAAFVCMAGTCRLPIDSAKSLREYLTKL